MSASAPAAAARQTATPRGLLRSTRSRGLILAGVILLGLVFLFGGDTWLSILDYTLIAAIATLALNVLTGYAGQISLGMSFFMGIGAYTAAWLGGNLPQSKFDPAGLNLSFFIWLPAAGIVAALAGALIGPTALRLKGFYLGIVTLSLVFIGYYLFINLHTITGGAQGRSFPAPGFGNFSFASPDPIFGFQVSSNQLYFLLLVIVLAVSAVFVGNVMRTRSGRAMQAVRDNETGATIMGVNLFAAKMGAFVLSSFLAGIAGALLASYPGFADPSTWGSTGGLLLSIQLIAAILIGGVASVWGSILGAAFVFALPQVLSQLTTQSQSASSVGIASGDLNAIIYGALIIVFLLFEPAGLIGLIRRGQLALRRFDSRRKGGKATRALASAESESQLDVESSKL